MTTAYYFGFPGSGHVIPSLPIIAELVRRGETITYFSTPEFRDAVERTGAIFRDYGAGFPLASPRTFARFRHSLGNAITVQLEVSEWALEHLAAELAASPPAYLMHDSLAAWGWYLAQMLHLPTAAIFPTFVFDYSRKDTSLTARARHAAHRVRQAQSYARARRLSERYHVPDVMHLAQLMQNRADLNFIITSREIQPNSDAFDPAHFKFIGPAVTPRAGTNDFPFEQLDERPLLLISLGTVFNDRPDFYQACFRAFESAPWQIVMSAGPALSSNNVPSNFIVRPFVPQLELLQRAKLFVSHGGMNSVNEALYYDVPLVMVPQGGDHEWIAARVAQLGAGIRLNRQVEAAPLRNAADEVLANPAYAQAAARLGASLRGLGGAALAADEILRLKRD